MFKYYWFSLYKPITDMKIKVIVGLIYAIIFVVTPMVSAELRTDRLVQNWQTNSEVLQSTKNFNDFMKKTYYYSGLFSMVKATIQKSFNKIIATLKGEEAEALLEELNSGKEIRFSLKDENSPTPEIEIYVTETKVNNK